MMRNILWVIILIMSACSSLPDGTAIRELENWLQQHDNAYSYCVIIPGAGCEGCISNSEDLVKEYSGRSDILFVFTRIETLKLLKYKLGEQVSSSHNLIYDVDNRFEEIEEGIDNIYPVVCFIKNDKVIDWCYVSPEEKRDVISELKRKLDSQADYRINIEDYLEETKKNEVVLSDLIDSIEYVPLRTPHEFPVDVILSVEVTDNNIYVLDKQQLLYRFERNGSFLNLIGNKGEGPEDYLNAVDFEIDEEKEIVYLFDNYRKKIVSYHVTGKFLQSLSVPEGVINVSLRNDGSFIGYRPWYMCKFKKDQLVLFGRESDNIAIQDLNDEMMDEEVKADLFRIANFCDVFGCSYVSVPLTNFVYKILDNGKPHKYIEFAQGKYTMPKEVAINTRLYNDNLNSSYIFELQTILIDKFVFLSFFHKMESYRVVYDMTLSRFYTVSKGRKPVGIVNDMKEGIPFWPLWTCSDKIIGVVPSDIMEENHTSAFCAEFKSYDNPILQIGYIRK